MNHKSASAISGRNARLPFIGMLMLTFGLLFGFSQTVIAGSGHPGKGAVKAGYTYSVNVLKDFSVAGSGESDILEITVSPTPPDPPGLSLTFSISTASYTPVITTNSSGMAVLDFASTVVGPVTVNVYNGPIIPANLVATQVLNFIATPGPVDLANSYLTVIQNPANADGVSQDVVEAVLYDQYGNPESSGTPITFSVENGVAAMTSTGVTVGNVATAYFTSTVVGSVQVQGLVPAGFLNDQANPGNNFVTIQFVVPPPSLANSYVVATTTPEPADGVSQDVVQAVVDNSLGQPVPAGTAVTFTIETGTATMTTTGITNGSGIATAYFTSLVIGSVQVQAQVSIGGVPTYLNDQANPGNNFVTIQFVIPPPSMPNSFVVTQITPMPADGVSLDVVQAVVYNSLGQPVPAGTAVTFTIETGTATMTTTGITNSSGVATAYFTSLVVGSVQVQAQVSIDGVLTYLNDESNRADNYVTIQFVTPPPSPANSYIAVVTTSEPADGVSQDVVQAVVYNSMGQPVPAGTVVTFTIETGTATMTTTGITNGSGIATADFTSTVAGSVQVQAQVSISGVPTYLNDQANPGNNYVTIHFVSGSPVSGNPGGGGAGGTSPGGGGLPPGGGGSGTGGTGPGGDNTGPGSNSGYTVLFVRQDNQLANGVQQDSVIAYITDVNKNAVVGTAVTFFIQTTPTSGTISSGAQLVGNPTVSTDDSGMARIAITSTTPGTVFVDATIVDPTTGNTVLIDGSYQIVTFEDKPDTSNPQTALTVIVYEALADGVSRTAVEAHVVGIDGEVMADQPVTFSVDSGTAQIVTAQPVYTDANGNAIIYLTNTTPGYALVTATVDGLPIDYGSPARVYFAPINIYVPRVFTPNGDGVNDILKPILVGIQTFQYFTVYNRWGNIVYQTTDPNQGWDGTMKGVPQPVETYLWIAAGIDTNGKTIVQKGMTSLVR